MEPHNHEVLVSSRKRGQSHTTSTSSPTDKSTHSLCKLSKTTDEGIKEGTLYFHENDSCSEHNSVHNTLAQICCGGYVFYMSDGSPFRRKDVEPVAMNSNSLAPSSCLTGNSAESKSAQCGKPDVVDSFLKDDEDDGSFDFHVCKEDVDFDLRQQEQQHQQQPVPSNAMIDQPSSAVIHRQQHETLQPTFAVSNKCNAWWRLSDTQKDVLTKIQERVDMDREGNRYFTCAIVEGPGGSGKTRLMSHIMNHKQMNTLVLYVTKHNRRVQDFVHSDCLKGELDLTVQKPTDLSPMHCNDIYPIIRNNVVGRFALTANKLLYALCGLSPTDIKTDNTLSSLRICFNIFDRHSPKYQAQSAGNDVGSSESDLEGPEFKVGQTSGIPKRNIIILLDEYTMHEPPLIHAIAHHIIDVSESPLVLIMGGDKLQCGPVGWNDVDRRKLEDERLFSNDVRREIVTKMKYEPLEMQMEDLQRCKGDAALGACVKRLRRICEESSSSNARSRKAVLNLVLARYSVEAGVNLYRQEIQPNGVSLIRKIVPSDLDVLDFDGSGFLKVAPQTDAVSDTSSFMEHTCRVDEEEYDEKGVDFVLSPEPPVNPMYDMLPLVKHFTTLYTKLAEVSFGADTKESRLQAAANVINESVIVIRDLFPVFIVLTNKSCNLFAEMFLLALYTQVRERLLKAPIPDMLVGKILRKETWTGHLRYTLRQYVRSLTIDKEDAVQRQTLFVGMVYKMTTTFTTDFGHSLCNGELVVITSLLFTNNTLDSIDEVILRKLDRDVDTDFKMKPGLNKNRMTKDKRVKVMPFVPYISENIYQMQGHTMPKSAMSFIDLVNAPCKNIYVAVSRFQNSDSIKGIVIAE